MYLINENTMTSKAKVLHVKKMVLNQATQKPIIVDVKVSHNMIKQSNDIITLSNKPTTYSVSFKGFEMTLSSNGIYTSLKDNNTGLEYQAY
jgi:hypothetical protein